MKGPMLHNWPLQGNYTYQLIPEVIHMAIIRDISGEILTLWPADIEQNEKTAEAFSVVDPERVSSAVGIVNRFWQRVAALKGDAELSPLGKDKRISELAETALAQLASPAGKLREMREAYTEEAEAITRDAVPNPSFVDALHDIEIARLARESDKIATLLEMGTERERLALVRTPPEITGLKRETVERLRGSLVSPDVAVQLESRTAALEAAKTGIQTAIKTISPLASHMSLTQKRATVGEGFDV